MRVFPEGLSWGASQGKEPQVRPSRYIPGCTISLGDYHDVSRQRTWAFIEKYEKLTMIQKLRKDAEPSKKEMKISAIFFHEICKRE